MKKELRDVLQFFANLTGETVEMARYLGAGNTIEITPESRVDDVEAAIQVIVTALGANHIVLNPISDTHTVADIRTRGPLNDEDP